MDKDLKDTIKDYDYYLALFPLQPPLKLQIRQLKWLELIAWVRNFNGTKI